jgi:cysteine synthase B
MKIFGAEIAETDPLEGSDGAFLAVQNEVKLHGDKYFYPDQYNNEYNLLAHYNTTAPEIWEQAKLLGHKPTHFVSVTGTSGTFMGTSKRLREYNPEIEVYSVQPDSPFHGIEGTKHMGYTIHPGIYDVSRADGIIEVSTEEAYAMTRRLAKEFGLLAGISSGANATAAVKAAKCSGRNNICIVTILCDSGSRYLSDKFRLADR